MGDFWWTAVPALAVGVVILSLYHYGGMPVRSDRGRLFDRGQVTALPAACLWLVACPIVAGVLGVGVLAIVSIR